MKKALGLLLLLCSVCYGQIDGVAVSIGQSVVSPSIPPAASIGSTGIIISKKVAISELLLTDSLVALWQNGGYQDSTFRGNDLTPSHVDPDTTNIPEWSADTTYIFNRLVRYAGWVWGSAGTTTGDEPSVALVWYPFVSVDGTFLAYPGFGDDGGFIEPGNCAVENGTIYRCIQEASYPPLSSSPGYWIVNAPQKVSTGLSGLPYATQFNGVDNYLSRASTTDLQLGGVDFTIAVWQRDDGDDFINSAESIVGKLSDDHKEYSILRGAEGYIRDWNANVEYSMPSSSGWKHIVYTGNYLDAENTLFKLYVDGALVYTGSLDFDVGLLSEVSDFLVAKTLKEGSIVDFLKCSIPQLAI